MRSIHRALCAGAAAVVTTGLVAPSAHAQQVTMTPFTTCCLPPGFLVGSATVTLTICNNTSFATSFFYNVGTPTPGVGITPASDVRTVLMQPGECRSYPIEITCPVGQTAPIPLNASVVDASSIGNPPPVQAFGTVTIINQFKIQTPIDPRIALIDPFGPIPNVLITTPIEIFNFGPGSILGLEFDVLGPLQPLAPMMIPIAPGTGQEIELMVQAIPPGNLQGTEGVPPSLPPDFAVLILKWDEDGDGITEPHTSITYRFVTLPPPPCPTDLNGDGTTDGADLAVLLNSFGVLCTP